MLRFNPPDFEKTRFGSSERIGSPGRLVEACDSFRHRVSKVRVRDLRTDEVKEYRVLLGGDGYDTLGFRLNSLVEKDCVRIVLVHNNTGELDGHGFIQLATFSPKAGKVSSEVTHSFYRCIDHMDGRSLDTAEIHFLYDDDYCLEMDVIAVPEQQKIAPEF